MWMRHRTAVTAPAWAPPGTVTHKTIDGQALCSTHDTYGSSPPASAWFDCGDGWEALLLDGEMVPQRALVDDEDRVRIQDGSPVKVLLASDMRGRQWLAPVVLRPDGGVDMPLAIKRGSDGIPERVATPCQARGIKAAQFLRESVRSAGPGGLEVETECIAELLALTCHLPPLGIESSGLLDDMLCAEVVCIACGIGGDDGQE